MKSFPVFKQFSIRSVPTDPNLEAKLKEIGNCPHTFKDLTGKDAPVDGNRVVDDVPAPGV